MTYKIETYSKNTIPDGPTFVLVEAIRAHKDDFEVEGIFSKNKDAIEFAEYLKHVVGVLCVAPLQRLTLKVILDLLIQNRLKDLQLDKEFKYKEKLKNENTINT